MSKRINSQPKKERKFISNNTDVNVDAFDKSGNNTLVFISIKNIQPQYQCFSDWNKTELSKFWEFNKQLHKMTWQQVYATASKEDKRGLAYTVIPREKYGTNAFVSTLDKEIKMFELRVDNKIRVHGYRMNATFYLCFLDREHKICP
ncbi:MAG: hypothetical protein K2O61_02045 [Bacteroidaceae bacterium]|nr:hypothetical protein [Bacteroidaceae bacterium]